MPGLTTAEHQRARREARTFRNAWARRWLKTHAEAVAWCAALGATPRTAEANGRLWYIVTVTGFSHCPGYGRTLPEAVEALDANIANFCDHDCTKGPGGASGANIGPLCERRRSLLAKRAERLSGC